MENFFSKPLDQIDARDILSLIGTPEGQVFEIKSGLAAEKDNTDPWYSAPSAGVPRKGPGDYARQNIFRAVVAFANAEGGWLVLGLTETADRPRRADKVSPLPDCHELAERFRRAANDWIDPPLPSLQCRGIEMGDTPGEGVIVFRVPRSLDAPHRIYKKDRTQEAYRRVDDESKPMRMREIQDLTIEMARGQERIDKEFDKARRHHMRLKPQQSPKRVLIGFNIVLVSSSGPLVIDRPYLQRSLFERKNQIEGRLRKRESLWLETIDFEIPSQSVSNIRPMLRGGRKTWSGTYTSPKEQLLDENFVALEVFASGTIQLSAKTTFVNPAGLSIRWILADLANALCITERARTIGGTPDAEYAMQLELGYDETLEGTKSKLSEQEFLFGLLEEDDLHFSRRLGPGSLSLPIYRVGRGAEFPRIVKLVMDDLYNAVGRSHIDDFEIGPIC